MTKVLALTIAILCGLSLAADAQRFVITSGGGGGCTGTIDLSTGCKLPMLGG